MQRNSISICKKAQIGATLTWFVALVIIVFIIFLFDSASLYLAKAKGIGNSGISLNSGAMMPDNIFMQHKLFFFLEKPIGTDSNIYKIVSRAGEGDDKESERITLFKDNAKIFLDENFPMDFSSPYSLASLKIEAFNVGDNEFKIVYDYNSAVQEEQADVEAGNRAVQRAEIYILPNKRLVLTVISK